MRKKGFSLTEMILVILVVGISSLGITTVMRQSLASVHKPQAMLTAVALAQKEAERNMQISFNDVVDEHRDAPQPYAGDFSGYSWETRVTEVDSNNKIVEIRVHSGPIGYARLAFLRTNYI